MPFLKLRLDYHLPICSSRDKGWGVWKEGVVAIL
jgi:hypothetical protein